MGGLFSSLRGGAAKELEGVAADVAKVATDIAVVATDVAVVATDAAGVVAAVERIDLAGALDRGKALAADAAKLGDDAKHLLVLQEAAPRR